MIYYTVRNRVYQSKVERIFIITFIIIEIYYRRHYLVRNGEFYYNFIKRVMKKERSDKQGGWNVRIRRRKRCFCSRCSQRGNEPRLLLQRWVWATSRISRKLPYSTYNDRAVSYIHQTPLRVSVTGRFAIDHCVGECPSLMDERPVYYVGIYGREWLD